ncbi:50S ribosomal protein L4 [Candidatus Omnitrophota bacterium]
MASISILNKEGKKIGSVDLSDKIFNGKVNKVLLQQAISMYLANRRTGSANTTDRSEARGGGKKPWRQKGTGRARVGSIRSPLWRGGGVTFGPKPKDWHYQLPKKMKKLALISSLNAKLNDDSITVIDELNLESHKTKEFTQILKNLKLDSEKVVVIQSGDDKNLRLAAKNVDKVCLSRAQDINAYQIMMNKKVLLDKTAIEKIEKELAKVNK